MKALSIVAPSGSKIVSGLKTLEVRRWSPSLRPDEDLLIVENDRFLRADGEEDQDGRAVAIVRIASVRPFLHSDMAAACANYFEEGWLAWELTNIRQITYSKPVLAARGIYEFSIDI
ncbi:ASCH domain-containing protein [Ochrobactrum sp. XJ1]|nr:ASCH domain-containing protein [Brucella tritici]MCR5944309.1 ASCH domain-containing protein [Ochrobactrum sp. XJ1]